jgi:DNA-binding transcriptional ArsR family regulator
MYNVKVLIYKVCDFSKIHIKNNHHLNLLKNAGLLKWRKEGVWIHYKLSNPKLPENLKELLKYPIKE